jgi:hypothetical protein
VSGSGAERKFFALHSAGFEEFLGRQAIDGRITGAVPEASPSTARSCPCHGGFLRMRLRSPTLSTDRERESGVP